MKRRLAEMLTFYGNYFGLVSSQANYFLRGRVPMPFTYYQHAIGIRTDSLPAFENFFYNTEQASKANKILAQTVRKLRYDFPDDQNFGIEYGLFFKKMATKLSE